MSGFMRVVGGLTAIAGIGWAALVLFGTGYNTAGLSTGQTGMLLLIKLVAAVPGLATFGSGLVIWALGAIVGELAQIRED